MSPLASLVHEVYIQLSMHFHNYIPTSLSPSERRYIYITEHRQGTGKRWSVSREQALRQRRQGVGQRGRYRFQPVWFEMVILRMKIQKRASVHPPSIPYANHNKPSCSIACSLAKFCNPGSLDDEVSTRCLNDTKNTNLICVVSYHDTLFLSCPSFTHRLHPSNKQVQELRLTDQI